MPPCWRRCRPRLPIGGCPGAPRATISPTARPPASRSTCFRSISDICRPPARGVAGGRSSPLRVRSAGGIRRAAGTHARASLWPALSPGRYVSDSDSYPRCTGLSDRAAHGHALERHNGADLPAGDHSASTPGRSSMSVGRRQFCEERADAVRAKLGLRIRCRPGHLAFGGRRRPRSAGRDSILLTYFVDSGLFRMFRNRTGGSATSS